MDMLTGTEKYLPKRFKDVVEIIQIFKVKLFLFLLVQYIILIRTNINDYYVSFINQQLYILCQIIKVLSSLRYLENVTYNKFDIYFLGQNIECLLYNTCKITQIKH